MIFNFYILPYFCAKSNVPIPKNRETERVLLKIGSFQAQTFDELFERTKALAWEEYLPKDAKFWVAKATSVKSCIVPQTART